MDRHFRSPVWAAILICLFGMSFCLTAAAVEDTNRFKCSDFISSDPAVKELIGLRLEIEAAKKSGDQAKAEALRLTLVKLIKELKASGVNLSDTQGINQARAQMRNEDLDKEQKVSSTEESERDLEAPLALIRRQELYTGHPTYKAVYANDGTKLAHVGVNKMVLIRDLVSGNTMSLEHHSYSVHFMKFSPDGKKFVYVTGSEVVLVDFEADTERKIYDIPTYGGRFSQPGIFEVGEVEVSEDFSKLLINYPYDGRAELISLNWPEHKVLARLSNSKKKAHSIAISKDGHQIAMGFEKEVVVWDIANIENRNLLQKGLGLRSTTITTTKKKKTKLDRFEVSSVGFNSTGDKLVVATEGHGVVVWDLKTKKVVTRLGKIWQFNRYKASFIDNDQNILVWSDSQSFAPSIWSLKDMKYKFRANDIAPTLPKGGAWRNVFDVQYHEGTGILAVACDSVMTVWNIERQIYKYLPVPTKTSFLEAITISPDGKKIIAKDANYSIVYEVPNE